MLLKMLPINIREVFESKVSLDEISEIRIRANKPIAVNAKGKLYYLAEYGLCNKLKDAICASFEMVKNIMYSATEASVYSVNNQLKEGLVCHGAIGKQLWKFINGKPCFKRPNLKGINKGAQHGANSHTTSQKGKANQEHQRI